MALALSLAACGIPSGGPTAISKNNVPLQLLSPNTPTTVGSNNPPTVGVPELIYLASSVQTVAPVTRDIAVPKTINTTLTEVLGALLEGPTATESAGGLTTYLTGTKTQVSAKVSNGVATVDFSANPIQVVGANQTLAIAQVVFTATQQPGVSSVMFQIAGRPIGVPTANGATVPGPVDRTSYQPQAPIP